MAKTHRMAMTELHAATVILSMAALCGKVLLPREGHVGVPSAVLTCFRAALGAATLVVLLLVMRKAAAFRFNSRRDVGIVLLAGLVMAVHWVLYFHSVEALTVAVAMLMFFTYPVMTALLEPLVFRERFRLVSLFNTLLILVGVGVFFFEQGFAIDLTSRATLGILAGLACALLFAIRNLMSRRLVANYSGSAVMAYQAIVVAVVLGWTPFVMDWEVRGYDINYVLLLGIGCTGIGHMLLISCMTHLRATTAGIINCIQPIYGTLAAWAWLPETQTPTWRTAVGGVLILTAVVLEALTHRDASDKSPG